MVVVVVLACFFHDLPRYFTLPSCTSLCLNFLCVSGHCFGIQSSFMLFFILSGQAFFLPCLNFLK